MNQVIRSTPGFSFALLRVLAKLRGGDAGRAEQNGTEAWFGNAAIYAISYWYFAGLIPEIRSWGMRGLMLIALAFLVWLFWLLVLYLNSLILNSLHYLGLFRSLPRRRGQSILIAAATTAMALALLQRGSFAGELGAIWLTATAMNLLAALILALTHGQPVQQ